MSPTLLMLGVFVALVLGCLAVEPIDALLCRRVKRAGVGRSTEADYLALDAAEARELERAA